MGLSGVQNTIGKRDFTQNITGKRENGASPGHGRGHGKAAVFTGRIFLASKPRCHPASSEITDEEGGYLGRGLPF